MAVRKGTAVLIFLGAATAVWALVYGLKPSEPVYQGKPVRSWLEQFGTNHWSAGHGKDLDMQAETAIQTIGTNVAPYYLQLLTTRESPLEVEWFTLGQKPWLARFHIPKVNDYRHDLDQRKTLGAYGFVALGSKAKPYVPALMALNSNEDQRTRYLAVFALRCFGPVASEALPEMIDCLNDPDMTIRCDAATAVGEIRQEPEKSVRALMDFLEKNRTNRINWIASLEAVESLGKFGAQAKPATPTLIAFLKDPQPDIRREATNALQKIDPDAAAKAGVK